MFADTRPATRPAHRARPHAFLAAALACLFAVAISTQAFAAGGDLVWVFQGIEDVNCADEIMDQNSDGVRDIVLETFDSGATGDNLVCLSGGASGPTAVVIWSTQPPGGPSSSGGYGDECVQVCPDLNGDLIEDVLLGTAWGGRTAYGIDGTDGSVIWDFDTYIDEPPTPPESGWIYTICSIPDIDMDTFPDVFFGCGSHNNHVYHMSGHDGAHLWSLNLGDAIFATAPLNDVNFDGKADVAVGVGDDAPAVWCMRGGATAVPTIWHKVMPSVVWTVGRIADISGDGINDVLAGTWSSKVFAFNGVTGDTLWVTTMPGYCNVMRIAVLDDVNSDGYQDAAIGSWDDRAFVLSGKDGSQIWSTPFGGDTWAIERVEDVTGDGINDVVAGSFDYRVYLLDGTTGAQLWNYNTGNRLYFVMGTSDLTGNGRPDVFAGTQKLYSSPGGRGYLLEGGDDATAAGLPLELAGSPVEDGIELTLTNAFGYRACVLERHEGRPNGVEAARRFRAEVAQAYRDGLLTAVEALRARSDDPQILWSRISTTPLPVIDGRVIHLDRTAQAGHTYTYRFAFVSGATVIGYSPEVTVTRTELGSGPLAIPTIITSPNPLRTGSVAIEFSLPALGTYRLDIHDAAGARVATLHEGAATSRDVRLDWNGRADGGARLANGVYFVRLQGEGFVATKKVTLLR
jgi:outer membrane protein assembly factor BamB